MYTVLFTSFSILSSISKLLFLLPPSLFLLVISTASKETTSATTIRKTAAGAMTTERARHIIKHNHLPLPRKLAITLQLLRLHYYSYFEAFANSVPLCSN